MTKMKVSEMQIVLKIAGLLPEKTYRWGDETGKHPRKAIWRVVDSTQHDPRMPRFDINDPMLYRPITTWYSTKISALRAAMRILENQNEGT